MSSSRLERILEVRTKLAAGNVSLGTWQQIPNASVSEILGKSGYDWVAVDLEHGSISTERLPDLFRAIELGGSLAMARIAEATPSACKAALDAGAGGVIAPTIKSAEQVERLLWSCRWPPAGGRGVGFSRANLFGRQFDSYRF
jgi:2-dehydro-3-deoxyglucarate aldolase